jgi:hypothetical protein
MLMTWDYLPTISIVKELLTGEVPYFFFRGESYGRPVAGLMLWLLRLEEKDFYRFFSLLIRLTLLPRLSD